MMTIHKYALEGSHPTILIMPAGAEIIHVGVQRQSLCMWARVETEAQPEQRIFAVIGTGHAAPLPEEGRHVGSVLMFDESLVLHVFERAAA